MGSALIRFHCSCGKRLAAPPRYAGRSATCPKCNEAVVVPTPTPEPTPAATPSASFTGSSHPRLEEFHRSLAARYADRILNHSVEDGCPVLRFTVPEQRRQDIQLGIETESGQEVLVIDSEIGTIMTLDEMTTALQINRHLVSSRLYLDDRQVLQLEYRAPLDGMTDDEVARAVDEVTRRADEIEEQLFGIDVR